MNILLIRHGETNYQVLEHRGIKRWAHALAPLTEVGRAQIKAISQDYRLQQADLIVSSSYARALESAAILSLELNTTLAVEYDLHEWLPHRDPQMAVEGPSSQEVFEEFLHYATPTLHTQITPNGTQQVYGPLPAPPPEQRVWESVAEVRSRALKAITRYRQYQSVVVVSHAVVIASITSLQRPIRHAEIIPFELSV